MSWRKLILQKLESGKTSVPIVDQWVKNLTLHEDDAGLIPEMQIYYP